MFIEISTTTLFPVHFPKTTIASSSSTALTIARGHLIKTITSTCIHPFQSTTTTVYVRPKSKQQKNPNIQTTTTTQRSTTTHLWPCHKCLAHCIPLLPSSPSLPSTRPHWATHSTWSNPSWYWSMGADHQNHRWRQCRCTFEWNERPGRGGRIPKRNRNTHW